jgi:ribonuclease T2
LFLICSSFSGIIRRNFAPDQFPGLFWHDQLSVQWGMSMGIARGLVSRRLWERGCRAVHTVGIASSFVFLFAVVAFAQSGPAEQSKNQPGRFDFYLLVLSWSPSFCEASAERGQNRRQDPQCGGRPFAFVVHGLWPQYEHGFPAFCEKPAPRIDRALIDRALDMMPSPGLVIHEWRRHGTCSGMPAAAYFDNVRKARAKVTIPAAYLELEKPAMVAPGAVADAFFKANTGLSQSSFAVECDNKRLSEVRICLNKDLSFRDCPEVTRRACRLDKVYMPAVRGG